jgi:hypothetical protein
MHCLPAHGGREVSAQVIDGPRSLVRAQAANCVRAEQALLYALVCGGGSARVNRDSARAGPRSVRLSVTSASFAPSGAKLAACVSSERRP